MKDKKIIAIIGGGGFIGHNLALHLKEKYKCEVIIVDNFQVNNFLSILSNEDNVSNPELSKCILEERFKILNDNKIPIKTVDAREYHLITNFFKEYKPNYIVHLAAVSHANRSNKNPYNTFDHSFRTLENVLDAGRKTVEKLIYLSSSMVYGNFKENTVTEESPCNPIGIYGALKLSGEYLVKAYNQVFDLPYVILRPSALYGERCISRRVSQIFIENALSGNPISIEGDGDEKLDFTYIKDLIEGIGLCIFNEKSNNNTFNLTHGNARPINLLVDILKKNFTDLKVISQKRDKLMPVRGTLSIDKARDILGYVPRWPLEQGYQEYITWYSNLYKKFNLK